MSSKPYAKTTSPESDSAVARDSSNCHLHQIVVGQSLRSTPASQLKRTNGTQWLIPGLLPEGGLCFIAGASKSYKSWLALELAVSIASGLQCARNWVPTAKRRVLYVAGEDFEANIQRRIEGLSHAKVAMVEELALDVIAEQQLALDTSQGLQSLEQEIQRLRPEVIILDPLARFLPNTPESSAKRMGGALEGLAQLARKYSVTLVIVHHLSKSAKPEKAGLGMRGSSQLDSYYSSLALVYREGEQLLLNLRFRHAESCDRIPLSFSAAGTQYLLHAGEAAMGTGWVESDATYDLVNH